MYCLRFILLYNICCFATSAHKFRILQDRANENGVGYANINEYTNVDKYVETKKENHEGILSHQESKTLEVLMKRIGMLEDKLKLYEKDCMRITLLEEKLLKAEEETTEHSYRIKMLEKRQHKSEHARLMQFKVLQKWMKATDRRLLHIKMIENRLPVADERLSHMNDFELRLKRDEQYPSGPIAESILPPRTNQSMKNTDILTNNNHAHASQSSIDVRTNSSNYKQIPKGALKTLTGFISTVPRDAQHMRIGFSAVQDYHGERVHIGQTIIFHSVLFNEDGAFDKSTGMYRCPVSGAYFFTFTVCSSNGYRIHATLVVNGYVKFEVIGGVGRDNDALHDSMGTGSAIIQCHAGDIVWAKVEKGDAIGKLTFITGFLVWADTQSS